MRRRQPRTVGVVDDRYGTCDFCFQGLEARHDVHVAAGPADTTRLPELTRLGTTKARETSRWSACSACSPHVNGRRWAWLTNRAVLYAITQNVPAVQMPIWRQAFTDIYAELDGLLVRTESVTVGGGER